MKRIKGILLFEIIIIFQLSGQIKPYFGFSVNYPFIANQTEENIELSNLLTGINKIILSENYDSKPGFELDFGIAKKIKYNFTFNCGARLSYIKYLRNYKISLVETDQFNNSILDPIIFLPTEDTEQSPTTPSLPSDNGKTEIIYTEFPVFIDYSVIDNRIKIALGVVPSILTYSKLISYKLSIPSLEPSTPTPMWGIYSESESLLPRIHDDLAEMQYKYNKTIDKTSDGFKNFLISTEFNIQIRIFKQLWLKSAYSQCLSPLYDKSFTKELKLKKIDLGLMYCIN